MANDFTDVYVPRLWSNLTTMFETEVLYTAPGGGAAIPLTVILLDGASDEDSAPGRYCHIKVKNSDIPGGPMRGATIESDGIIYDLTRVEAIVYGHANCVIQERPNGG